MSDWLCGVCVYQNHCWSSFTRERNRRDVQLFCRSAVLQTAAASRYHLSVTVVDFHCFNTELMMFCWALTGSESVRFFGMSAAASSAALTVSSLSPTTKLLHDMLMMCVCFSELQSVFASWVWWKLVSERRLLPVQQQLTDCLQLHCRLPRSDESLTQTKT